MVKVKSLKIDGEEIHVFNSAIFIFEASSGLTLECNLVVTEVVVKRYQREENVIVEIELEDGRLINSIMMVNTIHGGLPQLHLCCDLDDIGEYEDFDRVNEHDTRFPNIEEGITLEDIRKVEMPIESITLKIKLPIDQVEWLKKQKKSELEEMLSQFIEMKNNE
ncbi:hypothetical protein CJ195_17130 [Bacillus sp. UMB0899]|uniref:hypothetical protein n=1 Tax=Metabacillus schmidteae TaxID=2730405 RepID=UPI000C7FFF41|nr:hypothetical protein [Metabacillus schmidteae]PMC35976.1 hypothetical protein CJ195_17130 [Bacillus sp. UMB0899]